MDMNNSLPPFLIYSHGQDCCCHENMIVIHHIASEYSLCIPMPPVKFSCISGEKYEKEVKIGFYP